MTDQKLIRMIEANGLTLHGDIEHFAHLVAAAEREACAQACEEFEEDMGHGIPQRCANAIRARGEK